MGMNAIKVRKSEEGWWVVWLYDDIIQRRWTWEGAMRTANHMAMWGRGPC